MRGLRFLDRWTDPDTKPAELLAGLAADKAVALLERLASVEPIGDAVGAFLEARQRVMSALETWHRLDSLAHGSAMKLLGYIGSKDDLAGMRRFATPIAKSDDAALTRLVAEQLENVGFFHSGAGQ